MHPALLVDRLSLDSADGRLAHGISFTVAPGERVALLGASGSGKSLTAAAVLGSLAPSIQASGDIRVFGQPVASGRPSGRAGRDGTGRDGTVAAIYQDSLSALNPLVTVGTQLTLTLRRQSGMQGRDAATAAQRLLASVGIDDPQRVMRGFAGEISGGQRQRVCIALALLCGARLLIADEPTTALDVVNQSRVIDVLRDYAERTSAAILFITHDLAVAAALCDRAIVLEAGRVVETASMTDLLARPQHEYSRSLVEAAAPPRDSALAGRGR